MCGVFSGRCTYCTFDVGSSLSFPVSFLMTRHSGLWLQWPLEKAQGVAVPTRVRVWAQRNFSVMNIGSKKFLVEKNRTNLKVLVKEDAYEVVCGLHDQAHPGQNGTWELVRRNWCRFPLEIVREVVNQCTRCQTSVGLRNPHTLEVKPIIAMRFLSCVQVCEWKVFSICRRCVYV